MPDTRRIARRKKNTTADRPTPASSDQPSSSIPIQTDTAVGEPRSQASKKAALPARLPTSYLAFSIGGELFALPLARAGEIARCDVITKVPNTPPCLRGVMNLRGTVIPVIDLAPRLGRSLTSIGARTCIVVLEVDWTGEKMTMGLIVENVGHVSAAETDVTSTPLSFSTRIRSELLTGLVPVGQTFAAVLAADRALAAQEVLEWSTGGDQPTIANARSDIAVRPERPPNHAEDVH